MLCVLEHKRFIDSDTMREPIDYIPCGIFESIGHAMGVARKATDSWQGLTLEWNEHEPDELYKYGVTLGSYCFPTGKRDYNMWRIVPFELNEFYLYYQDGKFTADYC